VSDRQDRRIYSVKEAAAELGLSPSALRMAERRGAITPARRDEGTDRFYTADDVAALRVQLMNRR
jgi:DNA-binding transcriptional MerR regulator